MPDIRNQPTMEEEARRHSIDLTNDLQRLVDLAENADIDVIEYAEEHDDEGLCPMMYSADIVVRIHTYGGGPAGGVEFDVRDSGHDWDFVAARTWHQDWFQPKGYSELDTETADRLWQIWGVPYLLHGNL